MRVLHVLYQSHPHQSGSTTRSSHLLRSQQGVGLDVFAITVPFQAGETGRPVEVVDGVPHYRTLRGFGYIKGFSNAGLVKKVAKLLTLPLFVFALFRLVRRLKPDVIHAHAVFYCGFAAWLVGRLCRVPTVYEVRSIWYVNSHASLGAGQRSLAIRAERLVLRNVDAVVAISNGIKENLAYPRPDSVIVGNAVFEADLKDDVVSARVAAVEALQPSVVSFGYIGSVIELEGLDWVLQAGKVLEDRGIPFRMEILGDGGHLHHLKELAGRLGLSQVRFHGRVGRAQVAEAYGTIDCIVNYRRPEAVAQMVTPLKPIEALAFGVPVIASDVKGIRELMPEEGCGVIYVAPGDHVALAEALEAFVLSREGIAKALSRGIAHVRAERTWEANGAAYRSLYEGIRSGISA